MRHYLNHHPHCERRPHSGQTLVEFALILPIFVLVLVGLFDFGRAIYAYNTIANAAREAARVAIVDQTESVIEAEAIKQGVSLGLTPAQVDVIYRNRDLSGGVPCNSAPIQNGCIAEITIAYPYVAATPVIGNLVGTLTLSSTARMPVERSYP